MAFRPILARFSDDAAATMMTGLRTGPSRRPWTSTVGDLIGRSLAASNVGLAELGSEIIVGRREIDRVNVKDPARGMPARSVLNAAWGQLISFTDYKAANAGGLVAKVDPRGTSQECDG
jgi:hypothetical protein